MKIRGAGKNCKATETSAIIPRMALKVRCTGYISLEI